MISKTEVAIIGAGPYGLSIAAHLQARSVPFRIFGRPMDTWAAHMPSGMCLKSDGFASNLYASEEHFTLKNYCAAHGLPYADLGLPVPLDTFVAYGLAFQSEMVPTLEATSVTGLHRGADGFLLEVAGGETLCAHRVIVATGVSHLEYVPPALRQLPAELCSHAALHHDLSDFSGREVTVIGAGASATDLAGLLHAQGAAVTLLSRRPVVFHGRAPNPPSLLARFTRPNWGLGPSWRSTAFAAMPGLFRSVPTHRRLRIVRTHLGPAGAWFVRDMVVGKVAMHCGYEVQRAEERGGRAVLCCETQDGRSLTLQSEHVISATGYRVNLSRLGFFDATLLHQIVTEEGSPRLSRNFESSVAGLYFVGLSAATTFGPLLRFALGARFAARRLASHFSRIRRGSSVPVHPTAKDVTLPADDASDAI